MAKTRLELREDFLKFHRANPEVYEIYVSLLRKAHKRGKKRIGIGLLTEVMRWEMSLNTSGDEFKLNNNHRAFYARRIRKLEPDLGKLLTVRRQSSKRV